MNQVFEKRVLAEIPQILAKYLEISETDVTILQDDSNCGLDLIIEASHMKFLVECKANSSTASLLMASRQLLKAQNSVLPRAAPLLVVSYMGKTGAEFCEENKLNWLDLSGNAHIKTSGLFIHVEGKPNRFKKVGRPENVFAPRSSRVVRQLLINHDKSFTQRKISQITGLDEGYTSRIIRKLEKLDLIVRNKKGALKPSNPKQLLDAWADAYDFGKHQILSGHVAARSGSESIKKISQVLQKMNIEYAATGLAAAWQFNHFTKFRLATFYLTGLPNDNLLEHLGFREDERGANVWLVVPNDMGVFQESLITDGINCVHPVQIYIDLKAQPERSKEASTMLLQESVNWGDSG